MQLNRFGYGSSAAHGPKPGYGCHHSLTPEGLPGLPLMPTGHAAGFKPFAHH